jgi:hypothetical protein
MCGLLLDRHARQAHCQGTWLACALVSIRHQVYLKGLSSVIVLAACIRPDAGHIYQLLFPAHCWQAVSV